jgi:hypothetical protein
MSLPRLVRLLRKPSARPAGGGLHLFPGAGVGHGSGA